MIMILMQEKNSYNDDEYCKQILYSNEYINYNKDISRKLILTSRFHLIIFIFLILISQSNALPVPQVNYNQQPDSSSNIQQPSLSFPIAMVQLIDRPPPNIHPQVNTYKVYRRVQLPTQNILPSYSNGAAIQVYDQTNSNNQQQQQQQQQLRRERQRRVMIDRMFLLFDEDANGQLSKDELYTLGLRLNIFPKFHHFLKQTPS